MPPVAHPTLVARAVVGKARNRAGQAAGRYRDPQARWKHPRFHASTHARTHEKQAGHALLSALAHERKRPLRCAQQPHAVVDAPRSEPRLGDLEAAACTDALWLETSHTALKR